MVWGIFRIREKKYSRLCSTCNMLSTFSSTYVILVSALFLQCAPQRKFLLDLVTANSGARTLILEQSKQNLPSMSAQTNTANLAVSKNVAPSEKERKEKIETGSSLGSAWNSRDKKKKRRSCQRRYESMGGFWSRSARHCLDKDHLERVPKPTYAHTHTHTNTHTQSHSWNQTVWWSFFYYLFVTKINHLVLNFCFSFCVIFSQPRGIDGTELKFIPKCKT